MAWAEIWLNVFFYVFALGAAGGAAAVAVSRNIVRSAFALLAVLVSVAAMYAIMRADFLAGVQVLVYVGGILVLIIFAVMLTHKITDVKLSNESSPGLAAACACFCLLFSIVLILLALSRWMGDPWKRAAEETAVQAGQVELLTSQWQSDGATGLARGGVTHEDRAVLAVRVPRPPADAQEAEFEVASSPGWKKAIRAKAGLAEGVARADVRNLPQDDPHTPVTEDGGEENRVHWRVRLLNLAGDPVSGWSRADDDASVDFVVYAGMTEPVARALSSRHLFAFEAVSVLLLAALVGAAFLARKEVRE